MLWHFAWTRPIKISTADTINLAKETGKEKKHCCKPKGESYNVKNQDSMDWFWY